MDLFDSLDGTLTGYATSDQSDVDSDDKKWEKITTRCSLVWHTGLKLLSIPAVLKWSAI